MLSAKHAKDGERLIKQSAIRKLVSWDLSCRELSSRFLCHEILKRDRIVGELYTCHVQTHADVVGLYVHWEVGERRFASVCHLIVQSAFKLIIESPYLGFLTSLIVLMICRKLTAYFNHLPLAFKQRISS